MTTLILHFLLSLELLLHLLNICVSFIVHMYWSKKHPGEDLGRANSIEINVWFRPFKEILSKPRFLSYSS